MGLDDRSRFNDMVDDIHEIRNNTKKNPEPGPGCAEAIGCSPVVLIGLLLLVGLIAYGAMYIKVYF